MHRNFRKPLILMTPKSLLRHKRAVSRLDEFAENSTFHRLLYDDAEMLPDQAVTLASDDRMRRIVLCSGKVYFDLYEEREKRGVDDVYLLRVEQLYPFPLKAMCELLGRFPGAEIVWCQEEPQNMGPWTFVEPRIRAVLDMLKSGDRAFRYAGRSASAATATGLMSKHVEQRDNFLEEALGA
jgi:2-oxoglutarate dehydrogenase E1 component